MGCSTQCHGHIISRLDRNILVHPEFSSGVWETGTPNSILKEACSMSTPTVGAHVSISGGVENAVSRQTELGGNCGQIFVGSPRGWSVSEISDEDAEAFRDRTESEDIGPWIVHGTYLINLATPKDDLAEKSLNTIQGEVDACEKLGIPYYVFHPGSHTGAGADTGVSNVGQRLQELTIPESVTVLLEDTAGKGTTVGKTFEQLATMIDEAGLGPEDLGVCLDTCHLFSAGYEFETPDQANDLIDEFDDIVGIDRLKYLHLNDSKHPFGEEKDEHEHIGEGEIGEQAFESFINQSTLRGLPMALETPTNGKGYEWNIEKVKSLYHAE